jgi:predicted transcriptional regulator of viral defense system
MSPLERFVDEQLSLGRATFSRVDAERALALKEEGLVAALVRLGKRKRIVSPHKGFYVILRPEDQPAGAPDPAQWIDPLMRYLGLDYRISLLRAAAFHGSSHQAAMVFQVIVPRQLRGMEIGRHRVQFLTQSEPSFRATNQPGFLAQLKTSAGFAKVAGAALTLLDSVRYVHKAGGINTAAQIVKDIGDKADPRDLKNLAAHYETSCVRRLGYLLELAGFDKQARVLQPFAAKVKTAVPLDPSVKPLVAALAGAYERNSKWKLILNEEVEVDF